MPADTLELRGVPFLRVFQMSGATNFFGEGYAFHRLWKHLGMDWSRTTFVAKTTTLLSRAGNMPLQRNGITPQEWCPKCIIAKPRQGVTLNAVGLSGPGTHTLLTRGSWQLRNEPFWISFMPVTETPQKRHRELVAFRNLLSARMAEFRSPFGLQLNLSCPNVGGGPLRAKPLLPLVLRWLAEARKHVRKPIIAGGGILSPADAEAMINLGAAAIALGVIGILRPWRMRSTIKAAYQRFALHERLYGGD